MPSYFVSIDYNPAGGFVPPTVNYVSTCNLFAHVTLSTYKYSEIKLHRKQVVPQDKITSPRYMDPQRNINDIIPLQELIKVR